jgi:hypothetical protein
MTIGGTMTNLDRPTLEGMSDHDILIVIYERQGFQDREISRLWNGLRCIGGINGAVLLALLAIFLAHCFG